jgi:4-hydroxy-tetrahydrodipicolinate reductase
MTPVPIVVYGAAGRMGRRVLALAAARPAEFRVVLGLERAGTAPASIEGVPIRATDDAAGLAAALAASAGAEEGGPRPVVIDFSTPAALLALCAAPGPLAALPLVSGTTGLDAAAEAALSARALVSAVVWAPNMSVGVQLLARLVAATAAALPGAGIEIVETHHRHKQDAPSGTAIRLGQAVREGGRTGDIHMHSLRMGEVVGDHDVHFALDHEVVTLRHRALSRDVFAAGALQAARFAATAPPGRYGIDAVLGGPAGAGFAAAPPVSGARPATSPSASSPRQEST